MIGQMTALKTGETEKHRESQLTGAEAAATRAWKYYLQDNSLISGYSLWIDLREENSRVPSFKGNLTFGEFYLQEPSHILRVKIREKLHLHLWQGKEKINHFEINSEHFFFLSNSLSPKKTNICQLLS